MTADTISLLDTAYDLAGLESLVWDLLARGAQSGRDVFHTGAMSSIGPDGTPVSRTMVLRRVDRERRLLAAYSDVRSATARMLPQHPVVSWVFYDARRRIELRAVGKTQVSTGSGNAVAETVWAGLPSEARHAYSRVHPMGTRLTARATSRDPNG